MTDLGAHIVLEETLAYFEMSAEQARIFLGGRTS